MGVFDRMWPMIENGTASTMVEKQSSFMYEVLDSMSLLLCLLLCLLIGKDGFVFAGSLAGSKRVYNWEFLEYQFFRSG